MLKRSILFIDADPNTKTFLDAAFENMTDCFKFYYAVDAEEAIATLTQEEIEIIIIDIHQAEVGEEEFLIKVKDNFPDVIRMAFCYPSNKTAEYRLLDIYHQLIPKPLDKRSIKYALFEALSFKDLMHNRNLVKMINSMENVPSLPALYNQILECLWSSTSSLDEVGLLISKDIGMSSTILKLANSAFFGAKQHFSSVSSAVSFLGINSIKTLVLLIHVFSAVETNLLKKLDLEYLWNHSFAVSQIAKAIAKAEGFDKDFCDSCSSAGLLHSVGRLVLAANFPDHYKLILEAFEDEDNEVTIYQLEKDAFDACHAEVGAYLLGIWGLPHSITNAVLYHDQPSKAYNDGLNPLIIVHVANVFSDDLSGRTYKIKDGGIDEELLEKLDLIDKLPKWREIAEELNIS